MGIGSLRRQVTLQAETPSSDDGGGYAVSWTDIATVWADITPLGGAERFRDGALEGEVTHRIRIRYRSDVTPAMRILYGARLFNIRAVLNVQERDRWLELLVEEGVAV